VLDFMQHETEHGVPVGSWGSKQTRVALDKRSTHTAIADEDGDVRVVDRVGYDRDLACLCIAGLQTEVARAGRAFAAQHFRGDVGDEESRHEEELSPIIEADGPARVTLLAHQLARVTALRRRCIVSTCIPSVLIGQSFEKSYRRLEGPVLAFGVNSIIMEDRHELVEVCLQESAAAISCPVPKRETRIAFVCPTLIPEMI